MTEREELEDSHNNQSSIPGVIFQNLIQTNLTQRLNPTEDIYNFMSRKVEELNWIISYFQSLCVLYSNKFKSFCLKCMPVF